MSCMWKILIPGRRAILEDDSELRHGLDGQHESSRKVSPRRDLLLSTKLLGEFLEYDEINSINHRFVSGDGTRHHLESFRYIVHVIVWVTAGEDASDIEGYRHWVPFLNGHSHNLDMTLRGVCQRWVFHSLVRLFLMIEVDEFTRGMFDIDIGHRTDKHVAGTDVSMKHKTEPVIAVPYIHAINTLSAECS